jgi:hypothetical protein
MTFVRTVPEYLERFEEWTSKVLNRRVDLVRVAV